MADIRINALATTAASTASDDFIAVDGSANGTRKLSAYSPTFGGNLTVSGTGTSSVAGVLQFPSTKGVVFNTSTDAGTYGIAFKNDGSKFPIRVALASDSTTQRYFQVGYYSNDTQAGTWTNSFEVNAYNGNTTLTGNLLVGGTVDGGQKLQVNGTGYFAGAISVTTANGSGAQTSSIKGGASAGDYGILAFANGATNRGRIVADAGSDVFRFDTSGGASTSILFLTGASYTTALTLDSSQNATFAGTVKSTNASTWAFFGAPSGGADRDIAIFGVSGVTNGFTVRWSNSTSTIRINLANLPTSATGLATGDLYNSAGTIKIA
jgi:hypothetical protein